MIQGWVGVWATNAVSQALSVEVMLNILSIGSVQTHNAVSVFYGTILYR